jgi:hypothetical protein
MANATEVSHQVLYARSIGSIAAPTMRSSHLTSTLCQKTNGLRLAGLLKALFVHSRVDAVAAPTRINLVSCLCEPSGPFENSVTFDEAARFFRQSIILMSPNVRVFRA